MWWRVRFILITIMFIIILKFKPNKEEKNIIFGVSLLVLTLLSVYCSIMYLRVCTEEDVRQFYLMSMGFGEGITLLNAVYAFFGNGGKKEYETFKLLPGDYEVVRKNKIMNVPAGSIKIENYIKYNGNIIRLPQSVVLSGNEELKITAAKLFGKVKYTHDCVDIDFKEKYRHTWRWYLGITMVSVTLALLWFMLFVTGFRDMYSYPVSPSVVEDMFAMAGIGFFGGTILCAFGDEKYGESKSSTLAVTISLIFAVAIILGIFGNFGGPIGFFEQYLAMMDITIEVVL